MKLRKICSLTLAAGLQVLPLTRVFVAATPATGSSFALIATWLAGAAALLGGVDAVSGASSISISPTTATTGVPFNGIVQYSGAHASSAQSWELSKNWSGTQAGCNTAYQIAPGLWLTNAAAYLVRVGGTPTTSGTYSFTMIIHSGTGCGGGDSDTRSATITISGGAATAPSISTQPASQTVTAGGNANFSVVAGGTAPLSYQWRRNGANVGGATTSTLALTGVTTNQAGNYTVVVSNSVGSVTSSAATLTVNAAPVAPSITTQPVSQTVTAGGNANFSVVAGGTAPLSYQWKLNGNNISGATTSSYTINNVPAAADGSEYSCGVTNSEGGVISTKAVLTVTANALIQVSVNSLNFGVQATNTTTDLTIGVTNVGAATLIGTASASSPWSVVSGGSYLLDAGEGQLVTVRYAPFNGAISSGSVTFTGGGGTNVSVTGISYIVMPANSISLSNCVYSEPFTLSSGGNLYHTVNHQTITTDNGRAYVGFNLPVSANVAIMNGTVIATNNANNSVWLEIDGEPSDPSDIWDVTNLTGTTLEERPVSARGTGGSDSPEFPQREWSLASGNHYIELIGREAYMSIHLLQVAIVGSPSGEAPTITTQPQSQTVTAGANVSFSVTASGTAPLSYQWRQNGANVAGATTSTLALTGVTTNQAGGYTVVVSNSVGSVTSSAATLTVTQPDPVPDVTRPTVAVTSPAANVVANPSMIIGGTASDNIGVKSVWYSVNGGSFNNATGSANWAVWGTPAPVPLTPGTNIVRVYGVDLADNCSLTNSRSFIYEPSGALSLVINGAGRVTGATNGQPVQSGRMLNLKAIPVTGSVFSNWVGVVDGTLVCVSNSPVLNIPLQPGLEITANFVPNPFKAVAGQFNGLWYETNGVKVATSGFFSLKLSERGKYSASLLTEGRRLSAAGQFDVGGKAANTVLRRGTNALTVTWGLDLSGSDQVIGTVGDGNWSAVLTGDRAVFNARTYPCDYAGKYTFVLPGTPDATLTPEGNSYGTVAISGNGVVKLKGYLADKTSIAQKVPLSKNGEWPLYVQLKSRKGALLSWINFADRPTDDFSGLAIWSLPPLATAAYYPSGFTDAQTLAGSRYTPPASADGRVLDLTNAIVLLSGGDLPQSYTNGVVIGAGSRVTQAYPNDLTATFTLSSGLFRGTFKPEGENGTVAIRGAVLQKTTNAFGCFFGKSQSGHVALRPGTLPQTSNPNGN